MREYITYILIYAYLPRLLTQNQSMVFEVYGGTGGYGALVCPCSWVGLQAYLLKTHWDGHFSIVTFKMKKQAPLKIERWTDGRIDEVENSFTLPLCPGQTITPDSQGLLFAQGWHMVGAENVLGDCLEYQILPISCESLREICPLWLKMFNVCIL